MLGKIWQTCGNLEFSEIYSGEVSDEVGVCVGIYAG